MEKLKNILIYSVPFALIVGINYDFSDIIGMKVSVGYTEFILFFLIIIIIFNYKIIIPKKILHAFLFSLFGILPSLFYLNKSISTISIIELIRWIEYFILFICVYSLLNSENIKKSLIFFSIATVCFIGVAIYQVFTFNFFEKRIYGTFLSSANINGESESNPNVAGAFMSCCFLLFYSFKYFNVNKLVRIILIVLQYICFILVLYTLSRSAFVGLIIGGLLLMYLLKKSILKYLIVFLLLILVCIPFLNDYKGSIIIQRGIDTFDARTLSGESVTARFKNTSSTLKVVSENVFFGIGFGDLENQFNVVPDNFYIHILAETGVLGFITIIIFLIIIFQELLKMKKNNKNIYFYYLINAFIAFYVSFLLENYAANLFRNPRLLGIFWYLLAIVYKFNLLNKINLNETKES